MSIANVMAMAAAKAKEQASKEQAERAAAAAARGAPSPQLMHQVLEAAKEGDLQEFSTSDLEAFTAVSTHNIVPAHGHARHVRSFVAHVYTPRPARRF